MYHNHGNVHFFTYKRCVFLPRKVPFLVHQNILKEFQNIWKKMLTFPIDVCRIAFVRLNKPNPKDAGVAELADAQASGACCGNTVWVQVPPSALRKRNIQTDVPFFVSHFLSVLFHASSPGTFSSQLPRYVSACSFCPLSEVLHFLMKICNCPSAPDKTPFGAGSYPTG